MAVTIPNPCKGAHALFRALVACHPDFIFSMGLSYGYILLVWLTQGSIQTLLINLGTNIYTTI